MTEVVLAGNFQEYARFMADRGFGPSRAIYVDRPERVMGLELAEQEIYVVGTFWERSDAGQIYERVRERIRK